MSRPRISLTLLVVVLAAVAGCPALSSGDPPSITIDDRDGTQYRLTVFAVPGVDDPTDVTFRATTEAGERRYVGLGDLQSGAPYANVTLGEPDARSRQRSVSPTGNTTTTVDEWEPGNAWGYVLEGQDDSLVAVDVVTCERGGQEYRATIVNGFRKRWTANCS